MDRDRKSTRGIADEGTTTAQEQQDGLPAPSTRYTSRGAIPPVIDGFGTAGPTASDLGYGSTDGTDKVREWAKHGSACEREPRTAPAENCLLTDGERSRYQQRFQILVTRALGAYQDALSAERVDTLIQKDEELSAVGQMLLSLVGLHIVGHLSGALMAAKQGALNRLFVNEVTEGSAERLIRSISDQEIQALSGIAFEPVKSKLSKPGTPEPKSSHDQTSATAKQQVLSYIGALKREAGLAFQRFEGEVLVSSDTELLVAWMAMQPEHHDPARYKQLVHEKVEEFKKSGVMDIGHKSVMDRRFDGTRHVDTRVVYVKQLTGVRLWYEKQSSLDAGFVNKRTPWEGGWDRRLDRPVPDEFKQIALVRSEARWGPTPTVEDPAITLMQQHGIDARVSKPLPAQSVFGREPSGPAPTLAPINGIPDNSVFAEGALSATDSVAAGSTGTDTDPMAPFRKVKI